MCVGALVEMTDYDGYADDGKANIDACIRYQSEVADMEYSTLTHYH
jgi:hypothetical protein